MVDQESPIPSEIPFQERYRLLLASTSELSPSNSSPSQRELIMGDPADWPFPDFSQAPIDMSFNQGESSIKLKDLLPGRYWLHKTPISRDAIAGGHLPTGASQGPHIYFDDYDESYDPTPEESDQINVIAIHEAAHQIDNRQNKALYDQLKKQIEQEEEQRGMNGLKKQKSYQELRAWELTIQALIGAQQKGVHLVTKGSESLRQDIIKALKSQAWLLDFEVED